MQTETKVANQTATDKLTAQEQTRLAECERIIRNHFETYKEAGSALEEIRDKRLYREKYPTFETYARIVWDMSKTQANRLIAAAGAVKELVRVSPDIKQTVEHLSESAVRPLTMLSPKGKIKAMQAVTKASPGVRNITAKMVTEAAKKVEPSAFSRRSPSKDGKGDLIRRSELLDELANWQKSVVASGKFNDMKSQDCVTAFRRIIRSL